MSKTKKFRKPSKEEIAEAVIRANRKGNRDAEIETASGFKSKHKVHKNMKAYNRKPKHRGWGE